MKLFIIVCISFFIIACEKVEKIKQDVVGQDEKINVEKNVKNSEGSHKLRYEYKIGTDKKYKNEIQVHLGSIKIKGLPSKLEKSLLSLNKNKPFKEIFLILSQKSEVKIESVNTQGIADIKIKTLEVILEDLMINGELSGMGTPMAVPIIEDNEIHLKASPLGNIDKLNEKDKINEKLGLETKLYNQLLDILDQMQPLSKNDKNIGESWDQSIHETIDISNAFPSSYKAKAQYIINLDLKNKLDKIESSQFHLGQNFDGNIQLDINSLFGEGKMILDFKGKGTKIVNNSFGLDQSDIQESKFNIKFYFKSDRRFKSRLGNPEIEIQGTLLKNHSLLPEPEKK